ncbi:hypothetical protein SLA2020_020410 [Shorea laevis]
MFSGEIKSQFCYVTSLQMLDLSHNNLSGMMLQCFDNLNSVLVLNLEGNNFHGRLPRSLGNCKMLEFLDLGKKQDQRYFPFLVGSSSRTEDSHFAFKQVLWHNFNQSTRDRFLVS